MFSLKSLFLQPCPNTSPPHCEVQNPHPARQHLDHTMPLCVCVCVCDCRCLIWNREEIHSCAEFRLTIWSHLFFIIISLLFFIVEPTWRPAKSLHIIFFLSAPVKAPSVLKRTGVRLERPARPCVRERVPFHLWWHHLLSLGGDTAP